MPAPKFLSEDVPDRDDDQKDEAKVVIVEDDEDQEELNEEASDEGDSEDESTSEEPFDGFAQQTDRERELEKQVQALREEIEGIKNSSKGPKVSDLTQEQFDEMAKNDPVKAFNMIMDQWAENRGISSASSDEAVEKATKKLTHTQQVSNWRARINERFTPKTNQRLKDAAHEVYKRRANDYGITSKTDPRAEYDAFVIALDEDPSLMPTSSSRGRASKSGRTSPNKRTQSSANNEIRLTQRMIDIGTNMGLDMTDPKIARRILERKAEYDARRLDK